MRLLRCNHERGGVELGERGDGRLIVVCVTREEGEAKTDDGYYGWRECMLILERENDDEETSTGERPRPDRETDYFLYRTSVCAKFVLCARFLSCQSKRNMSEL